MRLDTLGKPTLLQVVPEPKKMKAKGQSQPAPEIQQVAKTAEESILRGGEEKLGQIIEILARAKKENKKKKVPSSVAGLVVQLYKRVESRYHEEGQAGEKRRGSNVDIKG